MTVSTTSRLGIYRWDSGGDPFTRAQMDESHQALEANVAGFVQGTTRPPAAAQYTGFFHFDTATNLVSYCDGSDWYDNNMGVPADTVSPLDGSTSVVGTSVQFAREDHVHSIGVNAITATKIANGAVTADKLGANSVTATKISAGAVSNDKLGTDISAAKLVTGTLSVDRIAAGSITDAKLATGIDAAKLTGVLNPARITDGTISYGKIESALGLSVVGRAVSTTGVIDDIVADTDGHALRRSGATIGFGQIGAAGIANDSVALGVKTTGNYVQSLTAGAAITITGGTGEGATPTIEHADTSTISDVNNTGLAVVQSLTFDTYGHVTGASSIDFSGGVQEVVGEMVSSNTESGIAVTYDNVLGKLNFNVSDPVISLSGDVSGSATMTNLGNVTISTSVANDSHTHNTQYYTESEINTRIADLYGDGGYGGYKISYGTGSPNNSDGAANGSIYLKYV